MATIAWGASGTRAFEAGVDRGVLYPPTGPGVPWNGLTAVNEAPSGGSPEAYYLDGIKYLQIASSEEFNATIDAFSAPDEFGPCDGTTSIYAGLQITQQPRKLFAFCYRTLIGNDIDGSDHGYKLHLVYNALATPSSRNNASLGDSVDPMALSWAITTVPPAISNAKPSAHMVINSLTASSSHLSAVETILYGSEGVDPRMPSIADLLTIFATAPGAPYPSGLLYPSTTLYPAA